MSIIRIEHWKNDEWDLYLGDDYVGPFKYHGDPENWDHLLRMANLYYSEVFS